MLRLISLIGFIALGLSAHAQNKDASKFRLRAVLHDPLKPQADLYVHDENGDLVPLHLALEGLTEPQIVTLKEGSLMLFDSKEYDADKPLEHLAAKVTVPSSVQRAIVFLFPAGENASLPYRMVVVNDAPGTFPNGETRVINMTAKNMAAKAGEHSVKIPSAKISSIPKVAKRNDLNQAPTAFYQQGAGENEWLLIAERPMHFADISRNLILIYQLPGARMPKLRTLVDTELR